MPHDRFAMVVAIPAKDEAELLPRCLQAIAGQVGVDMGNLAVVVSANNCHDDTAEAARAMAPQLPFALCVREVALRPGRAHAGGARRHAMDTAAALCSPDGVIVTTDADGQPDPAWLASYHAAFKPKIAAVSGRVSTDWEELRRFPADVLDIGAQEWAYQAMSAQLEALCDPVPYNPWPNHNQTCGANAAIRRVWYTRIGGLPVLRTGEDGALFREVWRRDGQIRRDTAPHVTVSARLVGRAQGGMADALTSRHQDSYLCDDLLEPAADLERRACWRQAARAAFENGRMASWALAAGVPPTLARSTARETHFGEAWLRLEANWPVLAKHRIAASGLGQELVAIRDALIRHGAREFCTW